MEFRDKLLSSEIRHVTELVNVLSYELVIIHDFMEQQFGKSFKRFRERHLLSTDVGLESARPPSVNDNRCTDTTDRACSKTTSNHEVRRYGSMRDVEPTTTNSPHLTDPTNEDISDTVHDVSHENDGSKLSVRDTQVCEDTHSALPKQHQQNEDNNSGDSDDDDFNSNFEQDSNNSSDEDQTWPNKMEVGRRKKIWSKFDCQKLPGGRKIVTCRKCNQQVSAVAKRLERHYQQCVLGNKLSTASSSGESIYKGRKPLSFVWTHFNKNTSDSGQTIVTCKYCYKKVSNHATRLAKHLQNCDKSSIFEPS